MDLFLPVKQIPTYGSMDDLPPELLCLILYNIPRSDWLSIKLSCRCFYSISQVIHNPWEGGGEKERTRIMLSLTEEDLQDDTYGTVFTWFNIDYLLYRRTESGAIRPASYPETQESEDIHNIYLTMMDRISDMIVRKNYLGVYSLFSYPNAISSIPFRQSFILFQHTDLGFLEWLLQRIDARTFWYSQCKLLYISMLEKLAFMGRYDILQMVLISKNLDYFSNCDEGEIYRCFLQVVKSYHPQKKKMIEYLMNQAEFLISLVHYLNDFTWECIKHNSIAWFKKIITDRRLIEMVETLNSYDPNPSEIQCPFYIVTYLESINVEKKYFDIMNWFVNHNVSNLCYTPIQ